MTRITRKISRADTYLRLVRAFPFLRIRSALQHAAAMKVYLRVSSGPADLGTRDYLDVLAELIADYERRAKGAIDTSKVSAADLVRHRLEERGMSVSELARQAGIPQPNLSDMLRGRRDWSKSSILRLSRLLNIRAERFLK